MTLLRAGGTLWPIGVIWRAVAQGLGGFGEWLAVRKVGWRMAKALQTEAQHQHVDIVADDAFSKSSLRIDIPQRILIRPPPQSRFPIVEFELIHAQEHPQLRAPDDDSEGLHGGEAFVCAMYSISMTTPFCTRMLSLDTLM